MATPKEIIDFWFSEPMNKHWFFSTPMIDALIKTRFENLWNQARDGKLSEWMDTPEGCLALTIALDQFPLNIYRDDSRSFETEEQSRDVARHAIKNGFDQKISKVELTFLYMPFMHSEDLSDQDYSVTLFEKASLKESLSFAKSHREIIRAYGRFPHRNRILGRTSSKAEILYLKSKGAFLG